MDDRTRGLGWTPRTVARLTAAINVIVPRPLARALLFVFLLLGRRLVTAARLERAWRDRLVCDGNTGSCSQSAFAIRFFEQLRATGSFARLAGFLSSAPKRRVAALLEAFARVSLLAMLRHWLLAGGKGPRPLVEVQVACCSSCDQHCVGCYATLEPQTRAPSTARLAYLIDEAARCGAAAIHLIGRGEPFLDEERGLALVRLVAQRPHLLFIVATNGLHLTPALASAVSRTPNLLCFVSVDGTEAVNDRRRGLGTYVKAMSALRLLADAGAAFGFSCTVTAENAHDVVSSAFLGAMRACGCCLGVYTRFFSVKGDADTSLRLSPSCLARYRSELESARHGAGMPLIDLDELEEQIGCRARAGLSVYLDGVSGQVSPCIKTPWSPLACRLAVGDTGAGRLAEVLAHPFFERYRQTPCAAGAWCGADLGAEQRVVAAACAASATGEESGS